MGIDAAGISDVGQRRSGNEDAWYISPEGSLCLVADGLGGHAGGEIASSTLVRVVAAASRRAAAWEDPAKGLPELLAEADEAVRELGTGELTGMATTVVALCLRPGRWWVAHVGDSRAYLLRGGELRRLTTDHTPEQEGGFALGGHRSGMITRAVGIGPTTEYDLDDGEARPGDRFLLCSDGLTDAVAEADIAGILRKLDRPAAAAERLVDAANEAGGPDNITVIVVDVPPGDAA